MLTKPLSQVCLLVPPHIRNIGMWGKDNSAKKKLKRLYCYLMSTAMWLFQIGIWFNIKITGQTRLLSTNKSHNSLDTKHQSLLKLELATPHGVSYRVKLDRRLELKDNEQFQVLQTSNKVFHEVSMAADKGEHNNCLPEAVMTHTKDFFGLLGSFLTLLPLLHEAQWIITAFLLHITCNIVHSIPII